MTGTAPEISIILPIYNGTAHLARAIESVRASTFKDYELIVIDDASTDDTPALLRQHPPDVLVALTENVGPFSCRNRGAAVAQGRGLLFIDVDVELQSDTLERLVAHWRAGHPCVIGVYSAAHHHRELASIYKNLWVRHSYLVAPEKVAWFSTALGLIDRQVFEAQGGFDNHMDNNHIGDLIFGRALAGQGTAIWKDNGIQVMHWKRFGVPSLLASDFRRARANVAYMLRSGAGWLWPFRGGLGNLSPALFLSIIAAALAAAALAALPVAGPVALWPALVAVLVHLLLNLRFYGVLLSHDTLRLPAHILLGLADHLWCGVGAVFGVLDYVRDPDGVGRS